MGVLWGLFFVLVTAFVGYVADHDSLSIDSVFLRFVRPVYSSSDSESEIFAILWSHSNIFNGWKNGYKVRPFSVSHSVFFFIKSILLQTCGIPNAKVIEPFQELRLR